MFDSNWLCLRRQNFHQIFNSIRIGKVENYVLVQGGRVSKYTVAEKGNFFEIVLK